MTNTYTGSKRPYEGRVEPEHSKRPRESEPRDWRDVHLPKSSPHSDRRPSDDGHHRGGHGGSGRGRDEGSRDKRRRSRSRDRRDGFDRDKDRDRRHRNRDRDSHPPRRDDDRRRPPASPRDSISSRAHSRREHDSDREEGEISPRQNGHASLAPKIATTAESLPTSNAAKPAAPSSQAAATASTAPSPVLELELSTSPVPVEVALAARRAKRQAILAKYTGVSSVNSTGASPSPAPSTTQFFGSAWCKVHTSSGRPRRSGAV
ncbi:hypothetical protein OF83DRAFT_667365 [Amylostereum chailletii]|nr:hypothetical protein OF83DRAFT_667365 [Amylostereum chailletii]